MSRDVVLDIIFTKMIGQEYMAGVDCERKAFEDQAQERRILVTKGLIREYASAIAKQDVDRMAQVSKALDEVRVAKATELWNFLAGGRQQRDVNRDDRGRFSRNISNESASMLPEAKSTNDELRTTIDRQMKGEEPGGGVVSPERSGVNRREGQKRAGQVRAIQRLQDEMLDLFGEVSDDVLIIVETIPEKEDAEPERRTLGLKEKVSLQTTGNPNGVLPPLADAPVQITYGLKQGASPEARSKFETLGGLVDIGMRPESAMAYASGRDGAAAKMPGQQLSSAVRDYGGRKLNTNQEKAKRHYNTADKLGSYFTETGVPQLQSAGRALKATAAIGNATPDKAYEMAERANYRYRGMKDNLPKAMTSAMKAKEHQMLMAAFDDPELTPEKWRSQLDVVGDHLQNLEQRNKDVFYAEPYRAVLAAAIASTPKGVSPRDFLDRYNRDLAIMALIPELPADARAVKLGEKAGFGVPSSGVVIRPDGAFKEMFRGVGPDHYLPFAAKALPELRDGQYVRTRYRGGLTNEDVSMLVAAGGRKATVVSSSGMFTIELKPDTALEGRMRSPEVAAMAERYERILDQVQASGIYMKDLDPGTKEKLHAAASKFTGKPIGDQAHTDRYNLLENKERIAQSELTEQEIDKITADVVEQAKAGTLSDEDAGRTTEMLIKEALADARKEKVRAISLNAEGYGMAMETLKLQYPSIIRRVSYEPLKDFVNDRGLKSAIDPATLALRNRPGGQDSGYVKPGATKRYPKRWSDDRDTEDLPGAVRQAVAGAAPTATTATAATPAEPTAEQRATGVRGAEAYRGLYSARKRQIDEAIKDAKDAYPHSLALDPAQKLPFDDAKRKLGEFIEDALDAPELRGPDVQLNMANNPGWLAFMGSGALAKAVTDVGAQGITLGMKLAFSDTLDDSTLWDPDKDVKAEEARQGIDDVMSTVLLDKIEVTNTPVTKSDKYAFYVPPEVGAAIPTEGDINTDEVLAEVDKAAYDQATREGEQRIKAKAYMDQLVKGEKSIRSQHPEDEKIFAHGNDVDGLQDISVLGMLALQSRLIERLERAQFAVTPNADDKALLEGLSGGEEGAFYSQEAFEAARKDALAATQGVIGTEFMRRALGGGDAGPKGLTRVQKSDRPLLAMLESFLSDRALSKSDPQPRPRPQVRSRPSRPKRHRVG